MKDKIISIISLGVSFNWLSIFFSYKRLDNFDINLPIATGGFPLKIFSYPVPPMGHDWPPAEAWPVFFLNLVIWTTVAVVVYLLFNKKIKIQQIRMPAICSAIALSTIGVFYIMLKFD